MNRMVAVAVIVSMSMTTAGAADMPTDPIGGKPPAGSRPSVADLDYQVGHTRSQSYGHPFPDINFKNLKVKKPVRKHLIQPSVPENFV